MKKILTVLIASVFLLTACSADKNQADMSSYQDMKKKNQYRTGDYEEISKQLVDYQEGIYVIAHPGLDTSLKIIPALNDVLKDHKKEAFYIAMTNEEDFTTNVNRRIVEFDNKLAPELQSNNQRPFIILIDEEGTVKTFHAGMTELEFNNEPMSKEDLKTLTQAIETALFK